MSNHLQQLSTRARRAAQAKDWAQVKACARDILNRSRDSAEGYFLLGLAEQAVNRREQAIKAFTRAISLDGNRYDAAVELATQFMRASRFGEAVNVLQQYEMLMDNSPRYLDMAATVYTNAGQPEKGWPLYRRANDLQPGVDSLMANLAACSVFVGKIDEAKDGYNQLLEKYPNHQRNHYELSRLGTATDTVHIEQMKAVLEATKLSPEKNVYMYYALGKEFEDLECWDEAFDYYKQAGDAASSVANYDVATDVALIDKVIEVCNADWLKETVNNEASTGSDKTPVFVVGLPRTGTTLTERIISSDSKIESASESYFIQMVLKQISRVQTNDGMNSEIIAAAAKKDIKRVATSYLDAIKYRLGDKPFFIEKFPENFLYLGFIAKAFPDAKIVHLDRKPMDTCFAMYKQSFFRYAYSFDDLGPYYVAYNRLQAHWRDLLGTRLIEVNYEDLVSDLEGETRRLLGELGLEFEPACLHFEKNRNASNTASTVQIRQKIHTRSVNRWKCYEKHLQSLKCYLKNAGVDVEVWTAK